MSTLYMGVRFPSSSYRRILVKDINLENNVEQIKNILFQETNFLSEEFGKKKYFFLHNKISFKIICLYLKSFYTVEKF